MGIGVMFELGQDLDQEKGINVIIGKNLQAVEYCLGVNFLILTFFFL